MKIFFTLFIILFVHTFATAQRFDGQWKGSFVDNSSGFSGFTGEKIDYVLELETKGISVSGYSYTYFAEGAKRYYTICKLKGSIDRSKKEVTVTEFERTKFNTPPQFRNCFQTHKLSYSKEEESSEVLAGTWTPAPNQDGGCGFGKTSLMRRLLTRSMRSDEPKQLAVVPKKAPPFRDMNRSAEPPATTKPKSNPVIKVPQKKIAPPLAAPDTKKDVAKKIPEIVTPKITPLEKPENLKSKKISPSSDVLKRSKSVMKVIEIEQPTFTVQLYDNGEIDGDSVSLYYNGSLLASHKRLTDKPITFTLSLENMTGDNELTMFAENLGTIPPNTALMIVNDGDKRYEVRITSDTQKNGTIAFVHKESN
ncbi:MAG: hypothetical protein ABIR81_04990 [Ginsengibacter sp.]